MLKTRVIPCLLLDKNGLVKTTKFTAPRYVGDPLNAIKILNEKEVDELILLDITATAENRKPRMKLISEVATECFMPLCYGGGIRSLKDIKDIFAMGVEKAAINSYAVENPDFIKHASENFGSQSIVVSIDAKKGRHGEYEVFTRSGQRPSGQRPEYLAIKMEQMGAGEIFLNSIDNDGTMQGYDMELIKKVSAAVSIPVIASGGAGKLSDFRDAVKIGGASAVAAGSLFVFYGKQKAVLITYPSKDDFKQILE